MPASGVNLLDANVWLAIVFTNHTFHAKAKDWFNQQPDDSCAFCRITQMALLRHLTNSKIMGAATQTQRAAWKTYDLLAHDPRVCFVPEAVGTEACFRAHTTQAVSAHERWTDAYLAALALTAGLKMVTFDKGFQRYAGLNLELLSA